MKPKSGTIKVQVTRRYDAAIERVFDAFLDPAQAGKFMFATPNGQMIRAEISPRVGGSFVFVDRRPNGDAEHYGTYLEIDRPRKLVFKFAVAKDAAESDVVSIDFLKREKRCEISLTHEMSAKFEKHKDKVAEGWTSILTGLATTLQQLVM